MKENVQKKIGGMANGRYGDFCKIEPSADAATIRMRIIIAHMFASNKLHIQDHNGVIDRIHLVMLGTMGTTSLLLSSS
jgi:hypothetical protein